MAVVWHLMLVWVVFAVAAAAGLALLMMGAQRLQRQYGLDSLSSRHPYAPPSITVLTSPGQQ